MMSSRNDKTVFKIPNPLHFSHQIFYFLLFTLYFVLLNTGCATVPTSVPSPSVPWVVPGGVYHVIGTGDTLWRIAQDYEVDIHEIMRVNRITDANRIQVGQTLVIPQPETPSPLVPTYKAIPLDRTIEKRIGVRHPLSKWQYITVHHSATWQGNAASFHRDHRRRRMGGLFYHFVIGNGIASGDGEVEVGWRWKRQVESKRNRPYDIQICLVGDFNKQEVTKAQFTSLVNLIYILRKQYDIPLRHVRRHKDIKGIVTECPGRHFPFYWLLSELRKLDSRS